MRKSVLLVPVILVLLVGLACSASGNVPAPAENSLIKSFAPSASLAAPATSGTVYSLVNGVELPGGYQYADGEMTCQGVLFKLEEKNRHLSVWFPPGNTLSGEDSYRIETVAGCLFDVSLVPGGGYTLTVYK